MLTTTMTLAQVQKMNVAAPREGVTVSIWSKDGHEIGVLFRGEWIDAPPPDVRCHALQFGGFRVEALTELGEIFLTL